MTRAPHTAAPDRLDVIGHPWRVCLRRPDGVVVGAGVLVDRWHVLTCAHVVSAALGAGSGGTAPSGELTAVLPFVPTSAGRASHRPPVRIPAKVAAKGWAPASSRGNGDLTLLQLRKAAPPGYATARLARAADAGRQGVLVFGHPGDALDGVWARTRITGVGGPGNEWMQLDAAQLAGRSVTEGFSGAGAVDESTGEVLGVVVARDQDVASRVAWVIRMETAVTYLPYLATLLEGSQRASAASVLAGDRIVDDPGRSVARRLDAVERQQFFDRLWLVPGMAERSSRDAYVRSLGERSGVGLTLPRHADDRLDLWELMRSLAVHPDAVRDLIDMLRTLHPDSREVDRLEEFIERTFPDLLLEHAERVALHRLLEGVAPAWVGAALNSATTGFGIPPVTGQPSLEQAVAELEGYGRVRGGPAPPLLVFVDDLAHAIGGPSSVALHRWTDEVGDRLELPRALIRGLCAAADRRRAERSSLSLMVHLEPDLSDPDRYLMSALLMHRDRTERVLHRDDVARTLPEIAQELDEVLRLVPEGLGDHALDPVIEFVLPRALLAEPVEDWEFGRSGFPVPLGLRYPVVTRSLDRMRDPTYHPMWLRKSRRLAEAGHRVDPDALHCVVPASPPGGTAFTVSTADAGSGPAPGPAQAKALFARLTGQEQVVCLAVPHPPDASVPINSDTFAAGLAAGVPVVLWARERVDPEEFFELVRTVLADVPLEIPQRVLQHRREIAAGSEREDLPAVKVGVLFDDAHRLPARYRARIRLQAPQ